MPLMFTLPKMNDGIKRQSRAHSRVGPQSPTLSSTPPSRSGDHESQTRQFSVYQRASHNLVESFMGKLQGVWGWAATRAVVPGLMGLTFGVAAATSLMIVLLYYLVFVCKPVTMGVVLPHDFISNNVITTDGKSIDGISKWLEDFTHSVVPRNCHSHNDYWRPYPLFSALAAGCVGVEADIWLSDDGLDLLVGHDRGSLSSERTLQKMYLDPLLKILEHQNSQGPVTQFQQARGVFGTIPNTSLILLIDVKTKATETWPILVKQLGSLRKKQYLTRFEHIETSPGFVTKQGIWPGPVTVVGTGLLDRFTFLDPNHRSYDDYEAYHDTFIDAPLSTLLHDNTFWRYPLDVPAPIGQPASNSSQLWCADDAYYASASFKTAIGSVRTGFSQEQLQRVRAHVQVSRQSGLKSRYWDIPDWPIGYRDYIWKVLTEENVDMLNVDDLESAARRGWTQGYLRDVLWMTLVSTYIFGCGIAILFLFTRRSQYGTGSQIIP